MQIFLETERLLLRQFTPDDVDNVLALDSDVEVRRYLDMPAPPTRESIAEHTLPRFMAYYAQYDGYGFWAAIEKSSHVFLGWFHFRPAADSPEEIELGYRLQRLAWGKGYATEGARALLRKGFLELGVPRVVATALAANVASIHVMEKAGLTLQKRYWYKGTLEAVKYALDRDVYLGRRAEGYARPNL
jgi:RimJ/RimL family protein N-acetyltransferase